MHAENVNTKSVVGRLSFLLMRRINIDKMMRAFHKQAPVQQAACQQSARARKIEYDDNLLNAYMATYAAPPEDLVMPCLNLGLFLVAVVNQIMSTSSANV